MSRKAEGCKRDGSYEGFLWFIRKLEPPTEPGVGKKRSRQIQAKRRANMGFPITGK